MSRKGARHEFADLLTGGLGDLVNKVYRGQVADFDKARAVVVCSSGGTEVYPMAVKNLIGEHDLSVDVFVLYADPDASWTEENAEDRLDDIAAEIIDILAANPTGRNWNALSWSQKSQPGSLEIGGTEYRREQITLHFT